MSGLELLTNQEMGRADRLAIERGVASLDLMERAGRGVADAAQRMVRPGAKIVVLCGPGNNGGDGFVAARLLQLRGFGVRVMLLCALTALRGDAAVMAARWTALAGGSVTELSATDLPPADLIIDAMFGAGLTRALAGTAAHVVTAAVAAQVPVLAVDVPSGLDGSTGQPTGPVFKASRTVTFFRRKPGHLLLPGRALCGDVEVVDIGLPTAVLDQIRPATCANGPALWIAGLPRPDPAAHKYARGHAVVVSGPASSTGAARLGARGALRVGAGLVSVASPMDAASINAAQLTAIMVRPFDGAAGLRDILADRRKNAVLIGPGLQGSAVASAGKAGPRPGVSAATVRDLTEAALDSAAAVVLDADALTAFASHRPRLIERIGARAGGPVVITPHDGEFAKLMGPAGGGSRLDHARAAAQQLAAIVVLKGPDTVIAAPNGRAAINDNAPAWLATAGSGDVLAGLIAGLLAQAMPGFEAASAAVWLHGACATEFGPGLIAEDIPECLPAVLARLAERRRHMPS